METGRARFALGGAGDPPPPAGDPHGPRQATAKARCCPPRPSHSAFHFRAAKTASPPVGVGEGAMVSRTAIPHPSLGLGRVHGHGGGRVLTPGTPPVPENGMNVHSRCIGLDAKPYDLKQNPSKSYVAGQRETPAGPRSGKTEPRR